MAASWKELLTLIVTISLLITISSSQDAISTEKTVVEVDETELDDDDVGTDAGVHAPLEDARAADAAEQEPGNSQVAREPEAADETEIGTEPDETEFGGSKVEETSGRGNDAPPENPNVDRGAAPGSESHLPLDAVKVDDALRGVASESPVQVPVATDASQHEHVPPVVQLESKGLGEERQELPAKVVGAGRVVFEADPTEAEDEADVVSGGVIESGSVGQETVVMEVGKQPEGHVDTAQGRMEGVGGVGVHVEVPVTDGRIEGERNEGQGHGEPDVVIEAREEVVGGLQVGEGQGRPNEHLHVETVPIVQKENVVGGIPVGVHLEDQQRWHEAQLKETVSNEPKEYVVVEGLKENVVVEEGLKENVMIEGLKENVAVEGLKENVVREGLKENVVVEVGLKENVVKEGLTENVVIEKLIENVVKERLKENLAAGEQVGIRTKEQERYHEDQNMEMDHLPTSRGSSLEDANRRAVLPEKVEMGMEQVAKAGGMEDAEKREDVEGVATRDAEVVVDFGATKESMTDQAVPRDALQEGSKRVGEDGTGSQAELPGHDTTGTFREGSMPENEGVESLSQPLHEFEKDPKEHTQVDSDLKFTDKLSAQDSHHESGIPLQRERSGSLLLSGSGPALRSLLSEKVPTEEIFSKGDRPSWEQDESLEQRVADDVGQERTQDSSYEEGKELGEGKTSEGFPTDDDNSSVVSRFLTLRPYVILSERAFSVLDPWLDEIVRNFPPELQTFFLKAPFALSPSRALLLFIASCVSLLVVSSCAWRQSCRQKSRRFEKQSILEQLSTVQGALLISEHEKEAAMKELESLREQVQSFEDRSTLSSGEAGQLSSQVQSLTSERGALQQKVAQQLDQISDLSATVSSQLQTIGTATEKNRSLQKKLDETTAHAGMLESQLYELQTTLQQSQSSALEMQSQLQSMTEEISILQTSKDQLLLEAEGWNEKVQEQADQISKLCDQEKTHQEAIGLRDKEINVLRECYQQLKLFESCLESSGLSNEEGDGEDEDGEENKKRVRDEVQKKIKSMIDVAQVNAKLNATEEEKNSLKHALSMEMENRMEMEDQVKLMKAEMEKVMERRQEAEQQATRTALKMDVLVNYFKEKETDLNRKLGEQEARERASVDQLVNTDERTKEFENMVHLYKEQVEDLQKEIQSIEADYRKQIALQEKKAHENWLVARQSEREVKEYKIESQMLRHKILELQNKLEAATAEMKTGQEMVQTAPGLGLANGMPPGDDRPTSRPLLQPPFGPPPFIPGPFPPLNRPLPPPLFGPPMPPHPSMLFDRRAQDMRSPPPFDMWPPPSHMRRSPMPPRDRSPPRNRSPSPPSQRGRMSPTSLRGGRYSPPRGVRSPPSVIGDRHSPRFAGPRGGPGGNPRPSRPPHNRPGNDQRPGPRLPPHLQRSDLHVPSGPRSSTPDC